MTGRRRLVAIATSALALAMPACGADDGARDDGLGPGSASVTLTVRHSEFVPASVDVAKGTTVRFLIRNTDFIDHEFIVGPEEVHQGHETGRHARHGAVPGEVSVAAGEVAETTYRFDEVGTVLFACHLPRHLDYGMQGHALVHRRS